MTNSNGPKKRGKSSKKSATQKVMEPTKCEESKKRKKKEKSLTTDCLPQLMKVIKDYFKKIKKKATR